MEAWNQRLAGRSQLTSPLGLDGPRIFLGSVLPGCPWTTNATVRLSFPVPPSVITLETWYRNINLLSIAYAFRPRLRSRLTLSGRAFLRKPWAFDGGDSHPSFRYSHRHSHFQALHGSSRYRFTAAWNAPLPSQSPEIHSFGGRLSPAKLSAQHHSTSELLRIL